MGLKHGNRGRQLMDSSRELKLGATLTDNSCHFLVWAPKAKDVKLQIVSPAESQIQMDQARNGYFQCSVASLRTQAKYLYVLDGAKRRPDPASRYQPDGVHKPSQVCGGAFDWTDAGWRGLSLDATVIYEIHVGTFTPEGTFEAIIERLPALKSLGITFLELMPVAQFPGERNWGYDGVFPFATQNSYGGPHALKRLVNACHQLGIGVLLDVVYNHLGPEGNYLNDFGPYFTDCYKTPWGNAINFDGAQSDEVRRFFLENAAYWIREFHIDGLRLDAVHAIIDVSANRFLEELTEGVKRLSTELGRCVHVIAENDRNDARSLQSIGCGGLGFDSQWNDDFHHSIHALVTGERHGYYRDFGSIHDVAKACSEGFVYSGQYSMFRKRSQGTSSGKTPNHQFVVFGQNHDQIGNRAQGERLSELVDFETQKLVAGIVLLSPFVPLLFMGEEYGETAPFQYFVSNGDPELLERVREGRRREFGEFASGGTVPDPGALETFCRSRLNWSLRETGYHRILLSLYEELLRLRKSLPALSSLSKAGTRVTVEEPKILVIDRTHHADRAVMFFNFGHQQARLNVPLDAGDWQRQLDSRDERWGGPGSSTPESIASGRSLTFDLGSRSFVLFRLEQREVR